MPQFKVKDLMINILPTDERLRYECVAGGVGEEWFESEQGCGVWESYGGGGGGGDCLLWNTNPPPGCLIPSDCQIPSFCAGNLSIQGPGGGGCPDPSLCPNYSQLPPPCLGNSRHCLYGSRVVGGVGPQNLALLKAQLRRALLQVEIQERVQREVMDEVLRPKTLAEVEMLEQKMTAALEELKDQKAELLKRASKEQR
jgi:hypothetical protein